MLKKIALDLETQSSFAKASADRSHFIEKLGMLTEAVYA